MTNKTLSRKNFLKLIALSLGSLAFRRMPGLNKQSYHHRLMRVGKISKSGERTSVSVYRTPSDQNPNGILYQRYKDELINVYYEVESETGPEYNPIWYRVWKGYVHRAYLQEVKYILNPVANTINENFQLGEMTVPYTRAFRYSSLYGWEQVYRLYYQTTHWIVDIITGPDGRPWYQLQDELDTTLLYAIPAEHMRIVKDSEFDPISPDVPSEEKRIEISISRQELTAFEGDNIVLQTKIASGSLTPSKQTPSGEFRVQSTYPSKHMGNGEITDNIYAYELIGVPWSCFFAKGIATHGTFWHNDFGAPQSSGCVNMSNDEAKWLFRWVNPVGRPHEKYRTSGMGTRVSVI
jgi:hypothetical protein